MASGEGVYDLFGAGGMSEKFKMLSNLAIADYDEGKLTLVSTRILAPGNVSYPEIVMNSYEAEALRVFLNELLTEGVL